MNPNDPSLAAAQAQAEALRASAQANIPGSSLGPAAVEMPKSRSDQMALLFQVTSRIETGLANLVKNQESLERMIDTMFHELDLKVTELSIDFQKLKEAFDAHEIPTSSDGTNEMQIDQFEARPRGDPAVSTPPPAVTTSTKARAFADTLISTPLT